MPLNSSWRLRPGYTQSGWTVFTEHADTRKIYVAQSSGGGLDTQCGYAPTANPLTCPGESHSPGHSGPHGPKQNLGGNNGAIALLRDGHPDWMLLRRGDTWTGQSFYGWFKSGADASNKMVINAYGDPALDRPWIKTNNQEALYPGGSGAFSHVAFVSLHFSDAVYNGSASGPNCFDFGFRGHSDILLEDLYCNNYVTGLVITGNQSGPPITDVTVRRCVLVDMIGLHNVANHSQGLYAVYTKNVVIEQCLIDNISMDDETIFEHGMYVDWNDNENFIARDNIVTRCAARGIMCRPGGRVTGNLIAQVGTGIELGSEYPINFSLPGVSCVCESNVILDAKNDGTNNGGIGLLFEHIDGGTIRYNVCANTDAANVDQPWAIQFGHAAKPPTQLTKNIVFSGNVVYNWPAYNGPGPNFDSQVFFWPATFDNVTFAENDIQLSSIDQSRLIEFPSALSPELTSWGNRFWRSAGSSSDWFRIDGASKSLAQYKTAVGDPPVGKTASASTQVAYPKADKATIPEYMAYISQTASLQAFIDKARAQRKGKWFPVYTAKCVNDYIRITCFGK